MSDERPRKPGTWVKGQTGNPSGRPKFVEKIFQEELAKLAGVDNSEDKFAGIRSLIGRAREIAMTGEDKDANVAIKFLVERSCGLPKQQLEISEGPPPERQIDWDQIPLDEKRELLKAVERIEQLTRPYDGTEH